MKRNIFVLIAILFLLLPTITYAKLSGDAIKDAGIVAGLAGVEQIKSPETYATGIISGALAVLGIVFLILMVYGGFLWMTAKGDETQATKAKDTITMAVIGLMIVIASYAATQFIVKYIVGA